MADQRVTCGTSHPNPRANGVFERRREADGYATGPAGGCGRPMLWTIAYRCVGCGRWFHRSCILSHFSLTRHDRTERV
jgi:hypothetical protein